MDPLDRAQAQHEFTGGPSAGMVSAMNEVGRAADGGHSGTRMPYDPFGILRHHEEVRQKILAREPGYAQSVIGDVMVSFEAASFHGPVFAYSPLLMGGMIMRPGQVIDELILDVARGDGIASPYCFSRARVERIVNDLRSYPENYRKLHRVARLLDAYYLERGSEGAFYVY